MVENDVNLKTKPEYGPRSKTKVVNVLNAENFHGPEVTVFKQSVNYPPSKEDRENNNRIDCRDCVSLHSKQTNGICFQLHIFPVS